MWPGRKCFFQDQRPPIYPGYLDYEATLGGIQLDLTNQTNHLPWSLTLFPGAVWGEQVKPLILLKTPDGFKHTRWRRKIKGDNLSF